MSWIAIAAAAVLVAALGAGLAVVRARLGRAEHRFRILAEVAAVSDAGGSLRESIDAICDILVPAYADFCLLDMIEDGGVERAAVRVSGAGPEVERRLAERQPSVPERMLRGEGRGSLAPRFYERMSDRDLRELAHDPDDLEFLRGLGMRSAITVPLVSRGRVTGALTLGLAWSGRRYRPGDARFAWILSGRIALALDNSGLFADLERAERARAEIAEKLQRGLLPAPLPHLPGWSVAAMYRPAGAENEVGGDFYDVFRVPGGWMLAIGDVTGRGARAASITAVARYTLRTAVALTADPARALSALNRALLSRGDSALCTLAVLALDEDPQRPLRAVVAGHPPPLLVDGEAISEVPESGPVLGAFDDGEWTTERLQLQPGQQLVIVTDGIIEAEGADGRFGDARLRSQLRGASDPALAVQRLEAAVRSFTGGDLGDDVAMLALTRSSAEPLGRASVSSAEPRVAVASLDNVDE